MLGSMRKPADAAPRGAEHCGENARRSWSWIAVAALCWGPALVGCTPPPPKAPDVPEEDEPLGEPSPPQAGLPLTTPRAAP